MDGSGGQHPKSLIEDLEFWRDFPGAIHSDGHLISEPHELSEAKLVLALCDRWHKLPDEIYASDTATIMHLLKIEHYGIKREGGNG